MRRILVSAGLAVTLITSMSLAGGRAPRTAAAPAFKESACASMVYIPPGFDASRLRCGTVTVRENRARADSRSLEIAVAVVRASSAAPKPDPVLFVPGGPGQDAVLGALGATSWYSDANVDRDFVHIDPRGTGLSGKLACDEYDAIPAQVLEQGLTPDEAQARSDVALVTCHERYLDEGVDLSQYSSAVMVQDMIEVMSALGYETWNIIGGSWGTRFGLTAMRDAPEHIRSVVLDGPAPPRLNVDIERSRYFEPKLRALWAACAASARCNAAYPNIEQTYWNLIDRANAVPIAVSITTPGGVPVTTYVSGSDLIGGTYSALSDTSLLPLIPFAIDDIAKGNTGVLAQLTEGLLFQGFGIATGQFFTVECDEEWPFYTADAVRAATAGVRPQVARANISGGGTVQSVAGTVDFCKRWVPGTPDARENAPVDSDIPALILAGALDVTTPVEFGELAAETLPHAFVVSVPSSGHFVTFPRRDCTNGFIAAFLDNPAREPDDSCIRATPPIDFVIAEAPAPTAPTPAVPMPTSARPPIGVIRAPDTGTGTTTAPSPRDHALLLAMLLAGAGLVVAGVVRRRVHP